MADFFQVKVIIPEGFIREIAHHHDKGHRMKQVPINYKGTCMTIECSCGIDFSTIVKFA